MFAYIRGILDEISTNFVVLDANGVGYKIFVTEPKYNELKYVFYYLLLLR